MYTDMLRMEAFALYSNFGGVSNHMIFLPRLLTLTVYTRAELACTFFHYHVSFSGAVVRHGSAAPVHAVSSLSIA